MTIPNTVKIGANTFKVTRGSFRKEPDQDGGSVEWETNELFLANDMPEDREATCFLHEILHGVNVYLPEETVTYLSEALMQVIRDNNLDFRVPLNVSRP